MEISQGNGAVHCDKASVRFDSGSSTSSSARSHSPQTIDDSSNAENDSVDSEDVKGMLKQSLGKQLVLRLLYIVLLFPH